MAETPVDEPANAPEQPKDTPKDDDPFSDAVTDQAVDEIVRTESDELLKAEDNLRGEQRVKQQVPRHGFWHALGRPFAFLWRHPSLRWLLFILVVGGGIAAGLVPTSRYWVLNHARVQVSASARILDDASGQPLKNVQVEVDDQKALSNEKGIASFSKLALGPHELRIRQPGYGQVHKQVVLGLGSNPLGDFELRPAGVQYTFQLTDYLTGQPVANAEVKSEQTIALSDKRGKAILTLPGTTTGDIPITVVHAGYRDEPIMIKALSQDMVPVRLVKSRKTVFVTKQSGTYDVVSSDIDGQNKKTLLAGSGSETGNIALVVSPDGSRAAVVSTRDNQRDSDGYLLSTLSLITLDDGSIATVAHAEQIQLVDWVGTRLVFQQVSSDAKTPGGSKYSVISFDYTNNTRLQLAASSSFNTVFGAQGGIYYAIAGDQNDPSVKPAFYRVNADGSNKQTILDKEVWSSYRLDYNVLGLQTDDGMYRYDIKSNSAVQVDTLTSLVNRGYVDHPTNKQSIWVDTKGAQGVLYRYDRTTNKDTVVATQDGLNYPLRWLDETTIVFRVVTGSQVADYVVSTAGAYPAHKITDVTNTFGFSQTQ